MKLTPIDARTFAPFGCQLFPPYLSDRKWIIHTYGGDFSMATNKNEKHTFITTSRGSCLSDDDFTY